MRSRKKDKKLYVDEGDKPSLLVRRIGSPYRGVGGPRIVRVEIVRDPSGWVPADYEYTAKVEDLRELTPLEILAWCAT